VDDNLATRAVRALAEVTGRAPNVRLAIHKGIPIAGGMAGGSADAAAALVACDALWGTGMPRDNLAEIAATLGSDVPFLLSGGTALGTGRGERVSPVLARNEWHWVVAFARQGLSTPAVYGELDRLRAERPETPSAGDPANLLSALRDADPDEFGGLLANDLQPAAISLYPELRRTLRAGREAGAMAGVVSGSGPTCAFLARSSSHAVEVAAELAGMGVARTIRTAHGPVPGARLV
jgi:4-diphosphocytidyl-2-C-methyl-D-erythritol kinase